MHARYIVKDSFYKKAKKEGYRARSAYKLEEIQHRFTIIKRGDRVLDLGAAPGSWVQLESMLVGASGLVVGLDILPITPVPASNVVLKKADIREVDVHGLLGEAEIPAFDVITSDIAPNLSGIREADIARIHELYVAVLGITDEGLRREETSSLNFFSARTSPIWQPRSKPRFSKVTTFKPKASRSVSDEVYLIGTGKR